MIYWGLCFFPEASSQQKKKRPVGGERRCRSRVSFAHAVPRVSILCDEIGPNGIDISVKGMLVCV